MAPEGRPVAHPAAEALVAFATGSGEPPAWADTVRFYYGERLVRRLDRVRAGERSRWGVCPRGTDFECPISPLDSVQVLLEDDGGALIELDQVPAVVGCDKGRVPDLADGVELVVLRPEVGRQSCFEDFVVGLGVDADDRVESVIYLRSGP